MITSATDMGDRLRTFDRDYYEQLYRQQQYAFGKKWGQAVTGGSGGIVDTRGDFPFFPDIRIQALAIGQSRRILNNALLGLSRVLTTEPEPEYPQLDSTTEEVRKQIWLERWREYNYSRQHEFAWQDFDGVGNGILLYAPQPNPITKQNYACCRNIPVTQFIYDETVRSIGDANWCACVHYVSPEKAEAMYGAEAIKGHVKTAYYSSGQKGYKYVRITEYFDRGYATGDPSYGLYIGPWTKPFKRMRLPYPKLPIAYGEYLAVPGMSRPIGKILLQQATQEAINELEAHFRQVIRRGTGFDLVDTTQLDPQDLERLNRGDTNVRVRITKPDAKGNPPYIRIQNQEVAQSVLALLSIYERQYNADSQSTELDRGSMSDSKRSATENQLLDMRSQQGMTLTKHQTLMFYRRSIETFEMVAAVADRDPLTIGLGPYKITINDGRPERAMAAIFAEKARVVVGAQAVESQDVTVKQAQRVNALKVLEPFALSGALNLGKYLEELLKAMNERDPDAWMGGGPGAQDATAAVPGAAPLDPSQAPGMAAQLPNIPNLTG